jgi:hypothetical protein
VYITRFLCQHTVRSAVRASCLITAGRILVLISVRGWVDPRAIVRMETPLNSSGIKPFCTSSPHKLINCELQASLQEPITEDQTARRRSVGFRTVNRRTHKNAVQDLGGGSLLINRSVENKEEWVAVRMDLTEIGWGSGSKMEGVQDLCSGGLSYLWQKSLFVTRIRCLEIAHAWWILLRAIRILKINTLTYVMISFSDLQTG